MAKTILPFALWTPCPELGDTAETTPLSTLAGQCRTLEARDRVATAIASAVTYLELERTCKRHACRRAGRCLPNRLTPDPEHMCLAQVPGDLLLVMVGTCLAYERERELASRRGR